MNNREREREKKNLGKFRFFKQSTGFGKMQLNIHWS